MIVEFPQEIVDGIVDLVADDKATRVATLKDCSLASSQWLYRSQKHLFQKKWFTDATFSKWCEEIRPGEDGPSPHVTVLHYHANFTDAEHLTKHHIHLSSFTNLQKLHLRATPIHGFAEDELSMCFKQMGCSVRSISLRACKMTINDLVSFLRLFVKLERLSVIDPIVYSSTLDDSVDFPILGGVLELRYMFIGRDIWDFIHQLSLLPLAFHTVVLEGIHISLLAPINELLATCRESLARIDIRDHFVRNVNLTDCDALREMHLNTEVINHLPSIIRTVTSRQLREIRFIFSDSPLEEHYDRLGEWELVDEEICALVDRILLQPVAWEDWKLSLKFATPSVAGTLPDGSVFGRLVPASSRHKYVTISTVLVEPP